MSWPRLGVAAVGGVCSLGRCSGAQSKVASGAPRMKKSLPAWSGEIFRELTASKRTSKRF